MYNQGFCKRNVPQSTIKDMHKYNEKITNRGSGILTEKIPIQRRSVLYFKLINNSGRKTKSRYAT